MKLALVQKLCLHFTCHTEQVSQAFSSENRKMIALTKCKSAPHLGYVSCKVVFCWRCINASLSSMRTASRALVTIRLYELNGHGWHVARGVPNSLAFCAEGPRRV